MEPLYRVRQLAFRVGTLTGWRRNAIAFLFGALATLTLAPFFALPLLIPAFTGLYWLIDANSRHKRALFDGWWWGMGFYMTGLYWFNAALVFNIEELGWMIPVALFLIPGYLAICSALACWLTSVIAIQGIAKIFLFSVIFGCLEYVRGHLVIDFPWNLIGYAFGASDALLQLASIIGIYGLTWLAVFFGVSCAALGSRDISEKRAKAFVAIVSIAFACDYGYGVWRLHEADKIPKNQLYVENAKLRLVQSNVAQRGVWLRRDGLRHLRESYDLTRGPGLDKINYIIWGESGMPVPLHYVSVGDFVPAAELATGIPKGKILISGATLLDIPHFRTFVSAVAINHERKLLSVYNKRRLVPWGEFVPFRDIIPSNSLHAITSRTDISAGSGKITLDAPGIPPATTIICYEGAFPELASDPSHSSQWLLALVNDRWLGITTGPYQHFEMTRVRAVEQGLPLIYVAQFGISASVDSYGRVLASIPLNKRGFLDVTLQKPIKNRTIYSYYQDYFFFLLIGLSLMVLLSKRISICHKYLTNI